MMPKRDSPDLVPSTEPARVITVGLAQGALASSCLRDSVLWWQASHDSIWRSGLPYPPGHEAALMPGDNVVYDISGSGVCFGDTPLWWRTKSYHERKIDMKLFCRNWWLIVNWKCYFLICNGALIISRGNEGMEYISLSLPHSGTYTQSKKRVLLASKTRKWVWKRQKM